MRGKEKEKAFFRNNGGGGSLEHTSFILLPSDRRTRSRSPRAFSGSASLKLVVLEIVVLSDTGSSEYRRTSRIIRVCRGDRHRKAAWCVARCIITLGLGLAVSSQARWSRSTASPTRSARSRSVQRRLATRISVRGGLGVGLRMRVCLGVRVVGDVYAARRFGTTVTPAIRHHVVARHRDRTCVCRLH